LLLRAVDRKFTYGRVRREGRADYRGLLRHRGGRLARRFAAKGGAPRPARPPGRAARGALATELRGGGVIRAAHLACDVTNDSEVERAVSEAREALGAADVVVANAGFGVGGRVDSLTVDDFRRQFETNVFGVLRTIYATLDDLKQTKGRLAIVGSINGYLALPDRRRTR